MLKLSDGTEVDPATIEKTWVSGPTSQYNLWYTHARLYWDGISGTQYNLMHKTRDLAMVELDSIHEQAHAQGVHIGVRCQS